MVGKLIRRSTIPLIAVLTFSSVVVSSTQAEAAGGPDFSISAIRSGRAEIEAASVSANAPADTTNSQQTSRTGTTGQTARTGRIVRNADVGMYMVRNGGVRGVANLSLLTKDATPSAIAVSYKDGVALSWDANAAASYALFRDGQHLVTVTGGSFLDTSAPVGSQLSYQISAITQGDTFAASYGVTIVRSAEGREGDALAAATLAAASRTNANVVWRAFIRQAYIDSPGTAICDYSASYKFGGDNRGFSASGSTYRTLMQGTAYWNASGTLSSSVNVHPTKVYLKSTGALIATKTASSSGMMVQRLAQSTATRVEMYFTLHASNPFCMKLPNAIEGYLRIAVTQTGSYAVLTGKHLQMPAHEIYIYDNLSNPKTVYTRSELSAVCLQKLACDPATITGSGSY